jgi:hypothetical protein
MRKNLRKLVLHKETLGGLDSVRGGNTSYPPGCTNALFHCRPPTQTNCRSWCNVCPG